MNKNLYIICGDCGNSEGIEFNVCAPESDYEGAEVYVSCPNCHSENNLNSVITQRLDDGSTVRTSTS